MVQLKELLHYGHIMYDKEFKKDNTRIRIIKLTDTLYYTEESNEKELVINLNLMSKCVGIVTPIKMSYSEVLEREG